MKTLAATARLVPDAKAYVVDLTYTLTPTANITLSRWAFSGFCAGARESGKKGHQLTAYGPAGEVKLPNPSHLKPEFGLTRRAVVRLHAEVRQTGKWPASR